MKGTYRLNSSRWISNQDYEVGFRVGISALLQLMTDIKKINLTTYWIDQDFAIHSLFGWDKCSQNLNT